jgi:hypothetical protein
MGSFLGDICQQIENFHAQTSNSLDILTVYRCTKLSTSDFKKLQQSKDHYMSFNGFLSTTTDQKLAIEVCSTLQQHTEILPVLFEIKIQDFTSKFTPFVSLNHLETDILFSMTSIFHITHMAKNQENIWQV